LAKAWGDLSFSKASISAAVGGRPVRSRVARRRRVRRLAGAVGFRFLASRAERMKASMGVLTQALFLTAGGAGLATGWKAHHWRCSAVTEYCLLGLTALSGQAAPAAIQVLRVAMEASSSLPEGGIFRLACWWVMAWTRRLFSGSEGTRAGPDLPPLRRSSRENMARPPSFVCVWQEKQFLARTGRTLDSKNSAGVSAAGRQRTATTARGHFMGVFYRS
jgi:hypothetical protein